MKCSAFFFFFFANVMVIIFFFLNTREIRSNTLIFNTAWFEPELYLVFRKDTLLV